MVFGILWLLAFVMAANQFAIICSVCTWYFSRKDVDDSDGIAGDADVMKGVWWTYRYHFGSLAFGSFILACVWAIRIIFEYIGQKMVEATGENQFSKCLVASIRCCLDCFDRLIRYLNRNAYIYMAITSDNFCNSAIESFCLILKNMTKFGFVETIATMFMYMCQFGVAALNGVVAYLLLPYIVDDVGSPFVPTGVCFVVGLLIAGLFISIFDVGSNTILQCYLIDQEIAKTAGLSSKHIPPTLTKFFDNHVLDDDETAKTKQLNANMLS